MKEGFVMYIIQKTIKFIDFFAALYNINYNSEQKYYSIIKNLQNYCDNNDITLNNRKEIEDFLLFLEIPLMKQNIFKILNPDDSIIEENDFSQYTLDKLSDAQLLKYMMYIFSTITFNQHENLICLKYNIIIWNTGFHKLARICRGKIIDINTLEIVSYPFDKFFNINEMPDTKIDVVKKHLINNNYLYVLDKKDGSTIIVSKYKNTPLITTNGSFDNSQIDLAKELFFKKYPIFLKKMKSGYTYIFELIHPENRIVIDYGNEKSLYLLAVRDLSTFNLLSLSQIHSIANEFGFPYPEVYSFNNIDHIVHLAHTTRNSNREGWVLRIGASDGNEYMVKIKLDEYFEMHTAFDKIRLSFVYRHLIENDLDDFVAFLTDNQKEILEQKLAIIYDIRQKIKLEAISLANEYLSKYNFTFTTYNSDREKMIEFIKDLLSSESPFKHFALSYIKFPDDLDIPVSRIKISHMKRYAKIFGYDYNS